MQPDISIDADRWARAREWTWLEIEYLCVGIDPRKVDRLDPDVPLDLKDDERAKVREELDFQFRLDEVRRRLAPADALDILRDAGLTPPIELVAAVERAAADKYRSSQTGASNKSAQSRKFNKLLEMYLAAVTAKYGWRPALDAPSVVNAIVADAERLGLAPLDDKTVRDRLDDAVLSLSGDKRRDLAHGLGVSLGDIEAYLWTRKQANSPAK